MRRYEVFIQIGSETVFVTVNAANVMQARLRLDNDNRGCKIVKLTLAPAVRYMDGTPKSFVR